MNTIKVNTTQNIELEYDLASLGERVVGSILDGLIIGAYILVMVLVLFKSRAMAHYEQFWIGFIIPIFFYDLASEVFMNGQSVGKRVMNIKVISLDGNQATLGQYLIRWLFRLIDFTVTSNLCAFICVAVSEKKQRVGDMVAGTTVIRTIPRRSLHETIYAPVKTSGYTVSFPEVIQLSDKDMELVREVIFSVNQTGNTTLAHHAEEKIKDTLKIQSSMQPMHFLKVLLEDYNYLTSGAE